jgi:hypothetical protein
MEKFNITLYSQTGETIAKYLECRDFYVDPNGLYIAFFRESGECMKTDLNYLTERVS